MSHVSSIFVSFLNDIIEVFPEYKPRIEKQYGDILSGDITEDPRITEFLENIYEIRVELSEKDENLFETDPILLQNISFKMMWNSKISKKTKQSIWKYLQTFCIVRITNQSTHKIQDVLKCLEENVKVTDKETVKDMKLLRKLNDAVSIEEQEEEEEETSNELGELEGIFENTKIGKIAKDITDSLNIEEMVDGGGGIEQLFQGDTFSNIFKTITETLNQENDQQDLLSEATNICSSMQGNPLFSTLLNMQGELVSKNGLGGMMGPSPDCCEHNDDCCDHNTRSIVTTAPAPANTTMSKKKQKQKRKRNKNTSSVVVVEKTNPDSNAPDSNAPEVD